MQNKFAVICRSDSTVTVMCDPPFVTRKAAQIWIDNVSALFTDEAGWSYEIAPVRQRALSVAEQQLASKIKGQSCASKK